MTRAIGLGRVAVVERLDPEVARAVLSQAEAAALFGAVASQPSALSMSWHHVELGPDEPATKVLDADEGLRSLRDDTAGITCTDRDYRDDEPTIVDDYPTCDTDPSELAPEGRDCP